MEYIDITEKLVEFYRHLSAADVDRTIFSAKFGDGKTEFLHQFKEKYKKKYTFYTLYPVNYQIAPNEQIMEYIKRDLLFQLILNGTLTPIGNIPGSILLQWYINENSFDIVKDIIKFAPSIIGGKKQFGVVLKGAIALAEGINNKCKEFEEFKTKITEDNFEKATKIIEKLSKGRGNIYELDLISWLIAQSIANKGRKSVLIIEDLDRIDPAHLFRILNIFSAHIDRHYLCSDKTINKDGKEKPFDELPNKFGFDKIIFVMDAESTEAAFMNFYGNSNYEGYINKFFSKRVFEYSITKYAHQLLYARFKEICGTNHSSFLTSLIFADLKIEEKSVRDIARVFDNFENAYRREKVRITEDFCFLSDTVFVKLLAILERLRVKRNHLLTFFQTKKPNERLIKLLGCFAVNKDIKGEELYIHYEGFVYQMKFNKDKDGFSFVNSVKILNSEDFPTSNDLIEMNINEVVQKALYYVN
ncbi:hypothetical protein [Prevotella intermedia]|uniref:KAP NTPase domain-containing protein n=1 Tax=Prevotella intermedia TaxID=28131 RepID=A0A2A6EC90_PREIN|nr:hypothetical protein [Prevotella intermedia]PDP58462.1 hypothetical protein CLI71_11390 [Prevotella intermedia]